MVHLALVINKKFAVAPQEMMQVLGWETRNKLIVVSYNCIDDELFDFLWLHNTCPSRSNVEHIIAHVLYFID